MTERLYYNDPSLLEFDAEIVETGTSDGKHFTVLDKTAFYPTSGGQPHDTGEINSVRVIDVTEDDQGNIRHISTDPVGDVNRKVNGRIDRERRQYFRQLHTAQHILSRAFINLFESETVSVHLGEEYGAVELSSPNVSTEQTDRAEKLSNDIIGQNQIIETMFLDSKEAALLPLRKKPDRTGTIRIIKIGELDWSACGGTHCTSTVEVGVIKIIGSEKQRGHALVKFLAGSRAFEDYNHRFKVTDQLTKTLTCNLTDLPDRFTKLTDENKFLRQQLTSLQKELLPARIEYISKRVVNIGNTKLVFEVIENFDPKLLNQLAAEVSAKIGGAAALIMENRLSLAVSTNSSLDASEIVKQLAAKLGLKGGGNKAMSQLGGVDPNKLNDYKESLAAILNAK